jgi:hypothetical protein
MCMCVHAYTWFVFARVCIFICMYVCICIYIYPPSRYGTAWLSVCIYVHVNVHTYIHTVKDTSRGGGLFQQSNTPTVHLAQAAYCCQALAQVHVHAHKDMSRGDLQMYVNTHKHTSRGVASSSRGLGSNTLLLSSCRRSNPEGKCGSTAMMSSWNIGASALFVCVYCVCNLYMYVCTCRGLDPLPLCHVPVKYRRLSPVRLCALCVYLCTYNYNWNMYLHVMYLHVYLCTDMWKVPISCHDILMKYEPQHTYICVCTYTYIPSTWRTLGCLRAASIAITFLVLSSCVVTANSVYTHTCMHT